ncbi:MAG: hypothetical protein WC423_25165 [Vulcanimicrobiota bacterium]
MGHPGCSSKAGSTLLETVIAMFLLTAAAFSILQLLDRGVVYLSRTSQMTQAVLVAENRLARLRAAAEDPAVYRSGLSGHLGSGLTEPGFPGFLITLERAPGDRTTFTPSTAMESQYPAGEKREIEGGVIPVKCTVAWGSGQSLEVMTYLSEPPAAIDPLTAVRVTGGGAVGAFGSSNFGATFHDAGGAPVPGVTFSWSVESVDGNGTILEEDSHRSGSSAVLENKYAYNFRTGTWGLRPGRARMRATARYNGVEYVGYSGDIQFGGP